MSTRPRPASHPPGHDSAPALVAVLMSAARAVRAATSSVTANSEPIVGSVCARYGGLVPEQTMPRHELHDTLVPATATLATHTVLSKVRRHSVSYLPRNWCPQPQASGASRWNARGAAAPSTLQTGARPDASTQQPRPPATTSPTARRRQLQQPQAEDSTLGSASGPRAYAIDQRSLPPAQLADRRCQALACKSRAVDTAAKEYSPPLAVKPIRNETTATGPSERAPIPRIISTIYAPTARSEPRYGGQPDERS
jgi:hypothetical protein